MLRIEAGLIFAGYECCDQVDPFEAGIAFTLLLQTKQDDFSGREALLKRNANPNGTWSASRSRATKSAPTEIACTWSATGG
jgi:glycine cleavage system aminomethyltransferase T